ncbi:hypothetical protein M5K25_018753 [Dendrobium thyrsiflorum]|uniref:Inosine/uridine-preferring nucleoside hydrolase domain-containing protein n=1 Tax=Dendrobium thyrsiflorum TaxID=117978 RepID=A0ABD0UJZ7_DENTH
MELITSGSGVGSLVNNGSNTSLLGGEKVIIDTDPGIDDSMTILMAFQTPEIDVIGLTTIFGNVSTVDATRNALLLCEVAGRPDVPVAEGAHEPLKEKRKQAVRVEFWRNSIRREIEAEVESSIKGLKRTKWSIYDNDI